MFNIKLVAVFGGEWRDTKSCKNIKLSYAKMEEGKNFFSSQRDQYEPAMGWTYISIEMDYVPQRCICLCESALKMNCARKVSQCIRIPYVVCVVRVVGESIR